MAGSDEFLHYDADEAHIVRRLGSSVVSLWPTLPPEIQAAIRERALMVLDEYQTVQLDQQIGGFIEKNAGKR